MQKTLAEYTKHVLQIKKMTIDTYGAALTEHCHKNILPGISFGLVMLHLQEPEKPLPDMEMVLFSVVKEASTVPLSRVDEHFNTPEVVFRVLDEALELTTNAGFGDLEFE